MHLLPTNLAKLANLTDDSGTGNRWAATGVLLTVNADNTFEAAATDCKSLLVVRGPCGAQDEYPEIAAMKDSPNGHMRGIVPAAVWAKVFAQADKMNRRQPKLHYVATKIGETVATFGATNLETSPVESATLVEGRFPPIHDIIPRKTPKFKVRFDPSLLTELLTTIVSICPKEEAGVEMAFFGCGKPLKFTAKNVALGQELTAIFMPFSDAAEVKAEKTAEKRERDADSATAESDTTQDGIRAELLAVRTERDRLLAEMYELNGQIGAMRNERNAARRACDGLANEVGGLQDEVERLRHAATGTAPSPERGPTGLPGELTRRERLALKAGAA